MRRLVENGDSLAIVGKQGQLYTTTWRVVTSGSLGHIHLRSNAGGQCIIAYSTFRLWRKAGFIRVLDRGAV